MLPRDRLLRIRLVDGVISTDDILPARYKHSSTDPADFRPHVFEHLMPGFASTLAPGDVIVGNRTFGIGSSREQAVSALKAAGVAAIIAPAFGRIFFRNAWNLGLPALEVNLLGAVDGDQLVLDLACGYFLHRDRRVPLPPIPQELLLVLERGGLLEHLRQAGYGHARG